MRWAEATLGIIAIALGTLWTLFGVGIVAIKPLICFDDCPDMMYGQNDLWAVVGFGTLAFGIGIIFWTVFRCRRRP